MSFNIDVTQHENRNARFVANIIIGNIFISSYPMPAINLYGDIVVNRFFLKKKRLRKIFFGNEPIVNISYKEGGNASAYIYKRSLIGSKKISENFSVMDAVTRFGDALQITRSMFIKSNSEINAIYSNVIDEISQGVYNSYLTNPIEAGDDWGQHSFRHT